MGRSAHVVSIGGEWRDYGVVMPIDYGVRDGSGVSRRRLLQMIGASAGSAAMYQAMSSPGVCSAVALQGTHRSARCAPGHLGAHIGRRDGGHVGRVRAAQCRLPRSGVGIQRQGRWPQLDHSRRRCLHRTRRTRPAMRIRPGPVHQPGTLAHSLSPSGDDALREGARCALGGVLSGQLQRVPAQHASLRRQTAALSRGQGRLSGSCRRAAGKGHAATGARQRRHQRGSGEAARVAARMGCARQELRIRL